MKGEPSKLSVAEEAEDETAATIEGTVIGEVDGLLWQDVSGVDIVSVTLQEGQVAVPVDRDEWRGGGVVELAYDATLVKHGPFLHRLTNRSRDDVVREVADHYSLNLGGPPPGPDPQPLPPWWDRKEQR